MVLTASDVPVVLLRGLTREQRHWGTFRPMLAEAIANPLLSFDFAGTGLLYQQRSSCNISDLGQSVRRQLQQEPVYRGKVHLVALSLGGMLAVDWALTYPDEVQSITLINSSARPLSPFYHRLRWENYPALFSLPFFSLAQREQRILKLTTANAYQDRQLALQWQSWQKQRPVSIANALRQLWAANRFKLVGKPSCPTLIISSRQDKLVSSACSEALAGYLQAEHRQHDWAGHDIALDDPYWLTAQISTFLTDYSA